MRKENNQLKSSNTDLKRIIIEQEDIIEKQNSEIEFLYEQYDGLRKILAEIENISPEELNEYILTKTEAQKEIISKSRGIEGLTKQLTTIMPGIISNLY